ncbi:MULTISPECIES: TIGR03757 family integrating conjugative element protein [Burkholderia]|jgi:integrating conjugative element protein (TIGR03757 family)|uniref:TIGR03757 family integrating conjugative element protein n=2 Tax=Burkholderia cepacia complex TaxID=87882 RepID=A0AAP2HS71_9BURK|nr:MULTISPECIES: TIGR03757 family integrating conjugative element protein [Burkholderia]ERI26655.1 integrating conjugative element protein, PFL_4709 family [Burkholderia cenocepacia BC7]MBU9348174.1 TIGR03757 family integrating conjugative element protein [Burkholderia multivorans]MBU9360604.1 TIGR03757 family integrating conjugative element protein [Burkholderia multivorans]MBU9366296.1 TIGR03757 family integrating conjugative element protein [Burkholderia multivorans]MBU9598071.1 TIGR03757 f
MDSRAVPHAARARPAWFAAGIAFLALATRAAAAEVWLVTDSHHPVLGQADRHVVLDAGAVLEAELAANLPTDQERASAIVQQRLKLGGADMQRRIGIAYQGIVDAWSLGVTKVPAIVVDRRYVVYGETDVARAVARIDQYRRTQP